MRLSSCTVQSVKELLQADEYLMKELTEQEKAASDYGFHSYTSYPLT
jgi:hypothetical protein